MIRNISYEVINKTHLTTDILIKFEDKGINKDQYDFIKDRLQYFKLNINIKYPITLDFECDYSKKILFIQIFLSLSDPISSLKLEQMINHISYKFIEFYEREILLFKK